MEPGVAQQPPLDRRGFVRRVVVQHDVHVKTFWDRAVDEVQEPLELHSAVACGHVSDDLPEATSRAA